ncbi:hypothetical protein ABVT39_010081 [Epinephelus coioides]
MFSLRLLFLTKSTQKQISKPETCGLVKSALSKQFPLVFIRTWSENSVTSLSVFSSHGKHFDIMFSLRLLFLTKSTQKQISKPETCGLVKSALAKQFPLVFISAWSENSVTSLSVFSSHGKHFDIMFSLRLLFLTKSTQKQISKPETCGLVKSALSKQFPLVFIRTWSENSVTSLSVFSSPEKHFDSMLSLRLLFLTKSTQKQISKPETCGLVKSALAKQFPLVFISAWSENSVTSLSVFSSHGKHFDIMFSLRLLFLTKSTQKQISKPETCGLVKSALSKQFPLVFISAWSENSVTSLSVFSSHGKHFDIMFSLRLLFLTKSTQKQISKPETCGLVKSALSKQFPLVFIRTWSENSVTSLSVIARPEKHFDSMLSLRLLFLTKSTQKQISKPETCGLVKSALAKQFPLVFISAWSENSVTSLSVFSSHGKHFDIMFSLRLLFLTKSTQKQISKPETCGLVKSALSKQFPLVFIRTWSENSVTSLSVFSSHGKHFDIMFSLRLLFLTKSTQKQISKPETCGLVKSALAKQFPLVFISAWSENSVTSLSVFSSHGKHFDIMFSLRLLFLTKSTQKQISKPETCGLVKSALAKQFPLVFISAWSENSVTSLSVFSSHGKHFDIMFSLRLLFLTKSTQKQISKPETCGLVKSALSKQFPLVFIRTWSENSVTSLSVFSSHGKHFDIMFSLRLLFLTKSTQKQISKPETCGLVKSALSKQFPLVFISAWSENSVTSLSVFSSHGKHFDIMFSLRLLFLTKSTQKQISKPETCGLVKSALAKQFPLVFISAWSENSPGKHFDIMFSLRLLFLTKSTQKQISKPETCGLVKSALSKQFPLVFIRTWSENSVTSLSVFSSHGKHFDIMFSLRLLFLTKSTQKQISKPETCGLVKSALSKQFPLVFISAWSENSVTSLSVFSSHGKHFDIMFSLRLLFLTKSTQKQISKPETCGLVKSALAKQFPLVFISAWSENSVTSLSVFSSHGKHFDIMFSLRLLFLTKSTQKQISKPETCGLVKSALSKQFPLVFIRTWSENSVTSLSVFSSHGKHFDIMFSLRLLFLTKSTQKQISKPETCGLVKSALAKQFPLVFISAWSENSVTSLSVFSSHGKHFDIMFSLRLLFLTKSTQKQISKPETCGLVKSALSKQFPLVFISAWSENSVTSLSVFSSHGKHFDIMFSLRLLFLTKSTQKQISKPETCGLVKSALSKQFPLVFIRTWSENSVTSLSVFARPEKHFDSMLSLRLLFLTKSTQKQISKPETCGLVKSALAKQFPLVFISAWSENSVTSLSVFSSHGKHFDIMFSLRLLFLTKSTQKQISKPETCGLVKSALSKQFPLVFIRTWSENSVTLLSVFSSHGKHFDIMFSLRLLFLTKSTQKQISKPETCGLVKSALAKQFPLVFISAWSENSVTSLSVFSSHGKHFDIMFSLRLLFLTKSTQKQISKPETCGLVKSALSKQFPLVFIRTWSENSVTSLSVFSSHGKHFDIMFSLRLLFLTKSTQKQISKPETCGLVKSALSKQFPLVFISAWSENSVTSLSVFSSHGKHFDIMFSLRLLFLTKSTQKQISKPETCGLVKSALAKQFPLVFISAWSENSVTSLSVFSSHGKHFDIMFSLRLLFLTKSTQKQISKPETCGLVKTWSENSVTSLSVFSSHGKHFDIMFSLRLLFLTKSTQKQISKPETCGLVKSALAKQFPLVFISAWSENSVTSLSVFSSHGKHFDIMFSLRLLFLTKSTQKQISKPETCGLVKSALAKQFPLVFISAWSENSVTHGKHFDIMFSLRLLFLTKSTQKQISKPETCGLVKSALSKQFPLVFIRTWSENSVTSLSVIARPEKHFDSMLSLRLLFLTKSTQKQISKPETCGLVKSALAKQFPLVFISAWSENSVTSLSVFSSHGKHFDIMFSLRLLFLTKSTQKQISKPETCGLVNAWSENSVTSLSVFSSHGKHFDIMFSLRLLFLTKSTQKQISKPETCGLVKSALSKQFPLVFISAWSENSVTSLSVFSSHGKHFDIMFSLRLLFLTKSTQKQISKPESVQFPLVFIRTWSENSVTSLSVFSSHGKHFDIMFSLRLLFLTKSTQKQISKPETCGLVKSALAKQFPLVFISAWSENSVTSLSVFSSHGKHFDIMFSLRLLFLTKSTQKQISKPETCGLVKSALSKQFPLVFIRTWSENSVTSLSVFSSHGKHFDIMFSLRLLFLTKSTQKQISSQKPKQFPLVFISAWSENSVTSLSVFSSHGKHFDIMFSLRLLFLTKSTQKQISKPETCGLVKSALSKQFPLVFIRTWSENSVTSLSVFSSHGKHFDIMFSLRLLFLTKSTQKQISKPETCGLVKSALAKQFPLVFISAWSENSVTSLSVFSSHGKHFDIMFSLRLLFLTKKTCGLVKSALAKQFPLVFISAWSENSVTSLSVFSSHGKHFDIMFSLRLLFLTKSTQKQISKPETCGLVKSALSKQFPLVFIRTWSENSVTSLSVIARPEKHFDSMLSLRLLFLTKSTQKQISKPETCGLVKSALAKQFPLVFISAWSENSVTSLSVFSSHGKHFDIMFSLRLLFLTKSTQKQISKPETCGLVKSALSKQFPLVFISAWSENSVTSLSVFSSHGKHFDIMFSLRLLFLTKSTQKQISKPETCGLVKSALSKQFPLVFIRTWSENSVTSLSVIARPEKHFDSMLSLRLLFLTKSTQKQISKPETCGLVKSALAKQFPLVFISAWSENSVTSLSVFSSHGKHFDIMFSLRLLFLTKSTQKQISKPETCGLVKSALSKQFPLVFIRTWSENSVTSLSVFSSHGKHFDIMFSLRLLFLTKSTQKQISKPETCGLVKSALAKQFPLVFISAWSENSVTSLSVFSSHGKHFDIMFSLRLLFLTKSTQKQISKPETCGLVKSALSKQFPLVFIRTWSENSPGKHFDIMFSLRLLFLTKSTQKQISKPETCGLVKSALSKQFPLVFISAWSENSVTSLSVFSSHGKHFDIMFSLRLLFLTKSTQKQISKPETCGLVKSALSKQFPLVFISAWSENSVTSLSVFSSHGKHFDIMFSLRLLFLTKSTQKQISKPETCGLVKSALAKQFPLVFISAWSENSVTSLSVFSSHGKHFDIMFSLRLLFLTKSTQKQISKPETCGLVKSALSKQFPLVFIRTWSENSVTSLSVFSSPGKHFDSMLSLRLLFLTKSTQKQISKPETCGLVKSALAKQFPLVFISAWSENSVTSLSVFSSHGKHFDIMFSLRLLFLTKSTQKQISKPETCGLVKSALSKQFPLVFIRAWSENSVTSLSVFSSHGKHFDIMFSLRLLFLTKSTQKQISKPETCGLVKSALSKQFPLVFIRTWSENSVTSLSVIARPEKHFDSMLSLRLLFLTKSTQKQISKPETCGLVKSALAKQFPLVFISAWSENSVTSLSVFSSHGKHFDIMFSLRLLFLTKSTQKQISKLETCGLVKSALSKQFPLVFIRTWSENSVTSLSVFSSHGKHFDIMFSLRLLFLTKSTQKQISKPETCGLVKSALSKQFPLVFISAWSENSVTSLSVFSSHGKHFDIMFSLRLLFLTKSTQKQISKPETCGLVKSALSKQFPLVFISAWSENSVTSLSVFSSHGKHFDIMFSLRLLFLTKSTQKQISKPETCGLVKSALSKQFPLVFIRTWSENSVTSLSVFSSHGKHFDIMFSLRLLFLTKSTQKQISKPETCGLVKSALAKQFPLVFISAWSENSVTSLSVFSSHGKHFDIMFSLRLLFLTKSTQKQISKPETCGLVKSALSKQFPLVFISAWSENSVTSLSVFSSHGKHFDIMFSLRLLFLTKSTQKQISKPETCGLVKSALSKQFPLVFIRTWSENSVTSLSVFSSHGKHFDIMFSLRLLFLTKSTQKQISKPETCGLVKSALSKQFPLVFISAWSENSVTSLSVFSSHGKHFDIMFSLRLLFLTKSTQKQISKPETCGLVKSALSKQFPLVFISAWSENSVTSLSVFSSHGKHFDIMFSLRLLFLTKSTQKQISKPETCGLVKSALSKQFPLVFIRTWSENSVTSLSVFSSHGKHFDIMFSLRLLFLTKSTQKQISKPETCGLVKSALAKQFPLVFISAWSENSVTSLSVFSSHGKHFDIMFSLRLLFLTKSTQKQISKPETCGLVKSALSKQFPLVFISAWSENSVTSLSVFSSHGKHFDIMFSLRLLFLTKSTQKQISKPETCGLVKSALSKQFPLVFIRTWSENSVTSLSVFARPEKHFDSMLSLRLLFLTKSTQKQISKPETCGLVKSALAKQFPLVFISAWSENSVTSLSVFSSHGKHFDIMFSLRLLFLTKSTQKQISKPETCGLVKSALSKQFPLVFISAWSENSVTSLSVFSSHGKHFDIMFSLRLLFLTKSTQKQISKPETCGLVKSALSKQFPLVFISAWSENSVTSLSVFSSHGKHFDIMFSLRLLFLTKSTQKQISKPETCGLVKSALSKQFPLVFIRTWSENSVTSLSVFSSHGKHFDIMFSLRLLFLTKSTQKQISKPETCGLVKSALSKQFPLVFISAWSENSVTSLSVFSSHGKHFDIMFSLRLLFLTKSTQKQISKPETCAWSENSVTSLSVFSSHGKHFDIMFSLRLLFLTKSTQKQISKPETCGLVKSALSKQFPLVFIRTWSENSVTSLSVFSSHGKHFDIMFSLRLLFLTKSTQKQISKPERVVCAWSENSVTSLSVFSSHGKHFDIMFSLRLLFLTKSTQKQISKPETCGLVKSALAKQFPLVFISAWSENSVTSLSVFSSHGKHFDIMFSLRLLFLTKSTQKQISKPETCGLVKSALSKQFPLVFIRTWSENSVTSLSVIARPEKHFDSMLSLRLLFLTKSTQKQISKPETCGLVKSALAKQFPLVFISAWSENSVTSLSVFSSHGKHFDIMFSLRLLFLTKSTQKQISKPETCGLVKSALSKQFPLVFIRTWSENSVTSLSVFSSHGKHFDIMFSLRLLFLTKSTQKQISKPETCGLVKSALSKQFPLVFISAWSENSVTSLSVFSSHGKHFDIMFSLRLLFLTKSTQKQISKPETCGLVKSALSKQFPLVFIRTWSENSVTSLSVFSSHGKHFDIMFSLRLLFLTKSTQKQISKPETCGLVKSALAKQFPLVFISAWSENSVTSLSVFSSHGKHFDIMFSLRLLFLTKSTQKQISKPETCGLVKSALSKQFPLVFIRTWSENSVTSLSVFSSHGKHFDIMFSLRLLFLTKSTQKQISKPETCGLVKSALSKQFPLVFISAWSENSVTSLSVFSSHGKHFDIMFSLRLLFLTKSTQKQISKPETCGLVKSALSKQFPLVFIRTWSENSVTSLSVFSSHGKHFDIMFSLRLLFLTKSTQKQISKPETCGLVKSALSKQFPLVFISAWSENSVTSLSVFSSHGKHFDIMFSLRLLFLTKSTQKQISKPETCGLVKSALAKQFPLVFISAWSENSVTSLSVFSSHGKHFDIMFSLRLLFLTKSTQKQISKPETCGLVKSALSKQFPLVFIRTWSENSVTSLSVIARPEKHFDSMLSLRLLFLTKSTQKQISKPETCGLVKSALAKQFPLVFISAWSENSVTSLSVFSSHGKHFDIMFSLRLLFLTKSTQKQISKPETCGLVKSALSKQFPLVFIRTWSENSVTSLSVFSSHGKHFDIMFSLRLLFLTKSTQKQISKPETCGLVKSALSKQFPLVFIRTWSENSVTSLSVFARPEKHFDSMLSLRLLFLTKSTQKQISKPETCGLVKSALSKQFPLVFIRTWSENSVTSLSVFSSHGKHFDIMFSLRLLFLTKSTQKQISKPETCGLVKSALSKQFPLVFISAWSENSVTSLSVFSSHGKHFDIMFSLRLLFLTKSTQKQISKPETCGLVKSALSKQFPLVFISAWSENSVTSLSVFSSHGKHFDIMFSLRLLFLTKSTQKQISKPETCGLVKSALSKQFPLVFISAWSENSVTSLSVFSSHGKHFDIMFSLRLLFLTKSTQKQISKPETCGLVKSALSKQFPLVFISAWSENSVTSLSVFSSHGKHFDIMFSLRLLFLTKSTQKQISKPETCGLVKSALSKQFPLVFIRTWSENSVTSLSVFSSHGKHFDIMFSLRLLFLTKSTQKQISKPETCGLVKSALSKQFPLVFIRTWSENSVTSLSVFSSHGKHFDIMFSLRLLFLTKSTQKQISKPETCGLVKSALSKQFPLVFISAWSENSVTSLSVFSSHGKHFDIMFSLRLLFLTKSTQKQISKPETCGLVKSALSKQFPLVFISAWSENSVTSLSVFSSHGKHFDIMFSLRLLFLTKSTQKQISKPETCGLVKSALSKQFPLVFIRTWSENSVTSLSVFSSHGKHFDIMFSLRLLFLTKSTQKQISKPETCGLVKSALSKQFPLVFISAWSENSVTSLSVFSSHGKHFDIMFSLRLLFLTKSTQKQISKPETCGLVKSALSKQFPLVFIRTWSENSVTSLSVFSSCYF